MPSTVRTYRETSLSELEIRELSRGSAWHSILALTSDWLLIVGAFFIVIKFPHPFSYAATFLLDRQSAASAGDTHARRRAQATLQIRENQ